jgi:integrase/recombinase XerD
MENKEQLLLRMKEDLVLRGLSKHTSKSYLHHVQMFLEHCKRPVEQINAEDIRKFLLYLIREKKTLPRTMNHYGAAIRFLYAVTLNQSLNYLQLPHQKVRKTLPEILSREEISSIIDGCKTLKHKALLLVAYSAGLRVSEVAALRIKDIDSKGMRIFVNSGKGGKDRYTFLSEVCLQVLRQYWREYRPNHPKGWLFPGRNNKNHITDVAIGNALHDAAKKANITKSISIHTLRHSFATHLFEEGATVLQIKNLLGHSCIQSTSIYVHLANVTSTIKSPLDNSPVFRSSLENQIDSPTPSPLGDDDNA